MLANPYQQYRTTEVETADPLKLVVMLYQGVLRFTQRGIQGIEQRDLEAAHHGFVRAQAIVAELAGSLDVNAGGDVSRNLMAIYDYAQRRLVEANCKKSVEPAAEVVRMFRELLTAWQSIAIQQPSRTAAPAGGLRIAV